ncbi:MAG: GNAT family N-acetyltransferase [Pseudomonadota bacterium]
MSAVTLHETDSPSDEDSARALEILRTFTRASVPTLDNHDYALLLKDDTGALQGGLIAQSRWGSFYIDILAVSDALRGLGWGTRLMQKAEAEARNRQCHHMWLDTYAFQAKAFYERHGFSVFGQIDGPQPYYPHYFMMKRL